MRYVALAGRNGFGVFNNEKRLENSKEYLSKASTKGFDSFIEAFCFARDVYNDLQDEFDNVFFGNSNELSINWLLFRNNIRAKNIEP